MKKVLLLSVLFAGAIQANNKPFVVVIPSYKNAAYYKKNLDSVFAQDYENFRVVYVDDASPDGTGQFVAQYLEEHNVQERVTLLQNEENVGALASMYRAVHACCDDAEIVVTLDGDDWFPDGVQVLQYLNDVYQDGGVWLTYGQYERYPAGGIGSCRAFPEKTIRENNFRDYAWVSSHLRTFYAKLFKHLKLEDLQRDGKFYRAACDVAQMFPMLELAGTHHKFIDKVLYTYNRTNPISVGKTNRKEQTYGRVMRSFPRYAPLKELFPGE